MHPAASINSNMVIYRERRSRFELRFNPVQTYSTEDYSTVYKK